MKWNEIKDSVKEKMYSRVCTNSIEPDVSLKIRNHILVFAWSRFSMERILRRHYDPEPFRGIRGIFQIDRL